MATIKGIFALFNLTKGDEGKDAVEAVRRYAELDGADPESVARYARAVARTLGALATELDREPGDAANGHHLNDGAGYDCPVRDGVISSDSIQADPCRHCDRVFHDRCFYTPAHPCVRAGLIKERPGYGLKKAGA